MRSQRYGTFPFRRVATQAPEIFLGFINDILDGTVFDQTQTPDADPDADQDIDIPMPQVPNGCVPRDEGTDVELFFGCWDDGYEPKSYTITWDGRRRVDR